MDELVNSTEIIPILQETVRPSEESEIKNMRSDWQGQKGISAMEGRRAVKGMRTMVAQQQQRHQHNGTTQVGDLPNPTGGAPKDTPHPSRKHPAGLSQSGREQAHGQRALPHRWSSMPHCAKTRTPLG